MLLRRAITEPERAVRRPVQPWSWLRELAWARAIADARNLPGSALSVQQAHRLIRTWGEGNLDISPEYLVQCHRAASLATGTILDFGAGPTTVVMALACRYRPASVLAFEHDDERRRHALARLGSATRRSGDVRRVPLEHRDGIAWPAPDLHSVRRPIAFVAMHPIAGLCDPRSAWERIVQPALPERCPALWPEELA